MCKPIAVKVADCQQLKLGYTRALQWQHTRLAPVLLAVRRPNTQHRSGQISATTTRTTRFAATLDPISVFSCSCCEFCKFPAVNFVLRSRRHPALSGGKQTCESRFIIGEPTPCRSLLTLLPLSFNASKCSFPKFNQSQSSIFLIYSGCCMEAIHVYPNRTLLNSNYDSDFRKLGRKTFQFKSCKDTHCGPNYCCCKFAY